MTGRRRSLWLAGLLFCGQLLLAWHLPSHLALDTDHVPSLISTADCEIGAHGQGVAPTPLISTSMPHRHGTHDLYPSEQQYPRAPLIPGAGARAPPVLS